MHIIRFMRKVFIRDITGKNDPAELPLRRVFLGQEISLLSKCE